MYGGIVIDTNNFNNKAGVRTFEASAYLRRNSADVTRVRKMFRDDANDYRAKAEAISRSTIYMEYFAITICEAKDVQSPTVIGAQAANELLDINGIKASFVLTEIDHMIYISARSIDEINVQLGMERLGGGGHINVAATQLKDINVSEAESLLKETIHQMIEKGEI